MASWSRCSTGTLAGASRILHAGDVCVAGVLDELCLSLAPLIAAGDAERIVKGPALVEPERFSLFSVLEDAGFLFTSYRRKR